MVEHVIYRSATVPDVDKIFKLISSMAQSGLMLRRSKYKIITMLTNFVVAESSTGDLAACGALLPLWTDSAEIVSLAVDQNYQGAGVGKALVQELLDRARRLGFQEVITLTYAVEFFSKLGFAIQPKDSFPRKLWRECLECPQLEECDETAMSFQLRQPTQFHKTDLEFSANAGCNKLNQNARGGKYGQDEIMGRLTYPLPRLCHNASQNESEVLCGTWVDDTAKAGGYKYVFDPDGKAFRYRREYDKPYFEGRYLIEKRWTDESGNTLYHCFLKWSFKPYAESKVFEKYFILFMIDASGETLRSVWSERSYPEDFSHGGLMPVIYYRQ